MIASTRHAGMLCHSLGLTPLKSFPFIPWKSAKLILSPGRIFESNNTRQLQTTIIILTSLYLLVGVRVVNDGCCTPFIRYFTEDFNGDRGHDACLPRWANFLAVLCERRNFYGSSFGRFSSIKARIKVDLLVYGSTTFFDYFACWALALGLKRCISMFRLPYSQGNHCFTSSYVFLSLGL